MKYKHRQERQIRNEMRQSRKYESRRSLRCKYDVNQFVNKMRRKVNKGSTFQGLGQADEVVDKYYIDSHFPPRDVLTELGEVEKKTKMSLTTIALIILGLVLLRKKA